MAWTDEKKQAVIDAYLKAEPTPETSVEIVKDIADEFEESPNGVRAILSKAEVYLKKATPATATAAKGTGTTRVSKAAAQESLTTAIQAAGHEVDEDIVSKLTGKAAMYFAGILTGATNDEE